LGYADPANRVDDTALPLSMTGPSGGLSVDDVTVTNFRCYGFARLKVAGQTTVLFGSNGAGKTNMLEAISLLSPGRGLRRAKIGDVLRKDAAETETWGVSAGIRTAAGEMKIGTAREVTGDGRERRVVAIDGEPVKAQADLGRHLGMLWLTPQMDRLFIEGAGERRRFLDRMVFGADPEHASRVNAYENAMRQRNRLLREGRGDPAWVAAIEETMAGLGIAIAAARQDIVTRLANLAADQESSAFPTALLSYDCETAGLLQDRPALDAELALKARLFSNRSLDAAAGVTTFGPHRADLAVRFAAKDMPAADCSTGEQKALLIGIVLANARMQARLRGFAPLLLLDEVCAHLDEGRRAALFDEIDEIGAQAFLTGADRVQFSALERRACFVRIEDATLYPQPDS
tara:strand:- start:52803 stop:54011 length:1209 start_codon:yes stop_codon:yes gene_type:complete